MKEFSLVFKFDKGLREQPENARNEQRLIESEGGFPKAEIIRALDELGVIDTSTLDQSFPFPQLFELKQFTLVCTETGVYTWNGSTLTQVIFDAPAGTTWSIADYDFFLVLTNGRKLYIHDPENGTWVEYVECAIPSGICLCNLNGQLLIGGPGVEVSQGFMG